LHLNEILLRSKLAEKEYFYNKRILWNNNRKTEKYISFNHLNDVPIGKTEN